MAWWNRKKEKKEPSEAAAEKRSVPSGLWQKCDECDAILETAKVIESLHLCPNCGFHFVMPTESRMALICDEGSFVESDAEMMPRDALGFRDSKRYADRLKAAARVVGVSDAFRYGPARIEGEEVEVGFFVFEFMGGSMGSVVGEKIARLFEAALARRVPAIIFNASGGARMQEGILSLMQMAKTTAALARLREQGIPYISVLLHPTTGGVAASFAMLGDIILAEPKALIGFAGPRVIEQTIRQKLPPGFQRSEFLLAHGMVDRIVDRRQLKPELAQLVRLLHPSPRAVEADLVPEAHGAPGAPDPRDEDSALAAGPPSLVAVPAAQDAAAPPVGLAPPAMPVASAVPPVVVAPPAPMARRVRRRTAALDVSPPGGERYRRALSRLQSLARFGVRPGLETIERLLARLGNPEQRLPAVHIAGTNGKGSTAAFAESLLRAGGVRVGLYTSPHLARFTERIRVDGREIEAAACAEVIERAFAAADGEGLEATFFEIATAAALVAFAEAGVEVAVLECGLGGRLDATSACRPRVSVITTIGLDHMEVLGDTLEAIAAEKAGIARAGVPLVVGRMGARPLGVIEERAAQVKAPLVRLGREVDARRRAQSPSPSSDAAACLVDYTGPGGALMGVRLGLAGDHQVDNAALALAAVGLLGVPLDEAARRAGLDEARWPGRLERVAPDLRVDGAHNPEGAAALARALAGEPRVTLLVGLLADKDAASVLGALLPVCAHLVCTEPDSPRALPAAALAQVAHRLAPALPVEIVPSAEAALAAARRAARGQGEQVVACGSLYLVGALRRLVTGEAADPVPVADPLCGAELEGRSTER